VLGFERIREDPNQLKRSPTSLLHRKELLVLGFLIVITVAVRVPGVFNRAIWYDEAITLLETAGNAIPNWSELPTPARTQKEFFVGSPSLRHVARGLRDTDVHPPVYYGLLSIWRRIGGASLEAARLFSLFWSTATVVLFYLLLRASGFQRPLAPSLVYALSSGAVHYAHEARNYSLALFFVIVAAFLAYLSTVRIQEDRRQFWILSIAMAVFCGLAFQTHYLAIFPVFYLLLWYVFWIPNRRRLLALPALLLIIGAILTGMGTLAAQLGARPKQFQKELDLGQELVKIVDFNFEMLWNAVISNTGVFTGVVGSLLVLIVVAFLYTRTAWDAIDKRLFTMMTGLAIVPSAGVLALDLVFSKNLGKSSYVLFGGPALVFLLTLAIGARSDRQTEDSHRSAARLARIAVCVIPFFIGLQLTGINFDLERTPGFAGSSLRSLTKKIESSSSAPVVVVGAGHGRGDPATVIYELDPDTSVCVLSRDSDVPMLSSGLASFDEIWIVFAKGRMTAAVEWSLVEALTANEGYRVVFRNKRVAHLKRRPRSVDLG
jgi:hypothetical protein